MTHTEYAAARRARGTQAAVAEKLGVAQNTIARREMGKIQINKEAEISLLSLPLQRRGRGSGNIVQPSPSKLLKPMPTRVLG